MNRTCLALRRWGSVGLLLSLIAGGAAASSRPLEPRRVQRLDGLWQVAEGAMDRRPEAFDRKVPVPGLLDMARPAFEEVGKRSPRRQAFWYRTTFRVDGPLPPVALLKVHKACYGTAAWLNGRSIGEHLGCFTPGIFDARAALRAEGQENELVVRVGADRETMPPDVPSGWDFEKYLYTPGIYDSVDLILTGHPFLRNVQVVPDLPRQLVRAVVEVENGPEATTLELYASAHEARSGQPAGTPDRTRRPLAAHEVATVELDISLPGAHLWTPEDPFLYELDVTTGSDAVRERFGMRSFAFEPGGKRALLNGKPYYLRGTNICAFRFFEDAARGDKPWREEWVRRLHRSFKTLHWNSIRYCIGFPPEAWYDIADEEGFLIQDEFPIWLLNPDAKKDGPPEHPKTEKIIPQYVEWMRERWNHPCVVIWDAQNESNTDQTGPAVRAVRHLDLSNRPWENGWAEPQSPADCVESHPYLFSRGWNGGKPFHLSEMPGVGGLPRLNDKQKTPRVPIIINEYCWLWLNRDGTPTCLTQEVYASLVGPDATADQRREAHARSVAALTEFWRAHRECAGVLHFCGLGYSRRGDIPRPEGGATSDHYTDLETLAFEPRIVEYLGDAFAPVGLMLDFWAETVPAGKQENVRVLVINDLEEPWTGSIRWRIRAGQREVAGGSTDASIDPLGRAEVTLPVAFPKEPGRYVLEAELAQGSKKPVRSLRDFRVGP